MSETPMLKVKDLQAWYGESHVLHGVDFEVREGEVVTLLGRNGSGRSTTMKSLMGLVPRRTGSIHYKGQELINRRPDEAAKAGIGYCPEERGIYAGLNVTANLMLPPVIAKGGLTIDEIHELFPNLKDRSSAPGTKLSGGEQQMLAIGRILRTGARLLLLDEPAEGLAPVIVQQIGHTINRIRERGYTVLLVEQNFRFAARYADRHYIMEHGKIIDMIERKDVEANMSRLHDYLGV